MGWVANDSCGGRLLTRQPADYYGYATDAIASGHLALKIEPRPELKALSNPYSGTLNQPYRVLDLSYFKGRYYFYWGLAPVVLLFGPVHLVTGQFVAEPVAGAAFGTVALACLGWLVLALRRRYCARSPTVLAILALLAIGSGSFLCLVGTTDSVYGIPIACAAFGQALALCCVAQAIHSTRQPVAWTLGAGIGIAVALGSRPNYVLWAPVLLLPLVYLVRRNRDRRWRLVAAAVLPAAAAVSAMLLQNYLRFGKATEFGMHYQLTGPAQPATLYSPANIPANLGIYVWNPPTLVRLFPFATVPASGPFGVFSTLPVVFGILGLLKLRSSPQALVCAGTGALAGLGGLVAMCFYFAVGARYQVDYLPAMVSAGALGLLVVASDQCRKGRSWPQVALGGILALSFAVAALLQLQTWGSKADRLVALARIFNAPVFAAESVLHRTYGPVQVDLLLPKDRPGAFEPILETGRAGEAGELVFLHYVDATHVRVGFFQIGTTHWLSQPIPTDYSKPHRLRIRLGSLGPPSSHPVFRGLPEDITTAAVQEASLEWDGAPVFASSLDFGYRRGDGFNIGTNHLAEGASGPRFSGTIADVRQLPFERPAGRHAVSDSDYGPWRIRLRFPMEAAPGRYDPLLVSGVTGAADFVNVFYPEKGRIAFSHDSWGRGGATSRVCSVDVSREHVVEIDHGGLYPDQALASPALSRAAKPMSNRLRITLDGEVVMDVADHVYPADPGTVRVGENRLGGSSTAPTYSGTIVSAERLPAIR